MLAGVAVPATAQLATMVRAAGADEPADRLEGMGETLADRAFMEAAGMNELEYGGFCLGMLCVTPTSFGSGQPLIRSESSTENRHRAGPPNGAV